MHRAVISVVTLLGCGLGLFPAPASWAQDSLPVDPSVTVAQAPSPGILDRPAGIDVVQISLEEALIRLQAASGVPFAYSPSLISGGPPVTCRCTHTPLRQALPRLLAGSSLEYRVVAEQVLVRPPLGLASPVSVMLNRRVLPPPPPLRYAAPPVRDTVIAGTVVDARSGRPLVGARVGVTGTSQATLTDGRGSFRLDGVELPVTIEVSMLGHAPRTLTLERGVDDLEIQLTERPIALDAMVVTGTPGAVQRRAIANSVGRLDAVDALERSPVASVGELLQGRAAGVTISPASGAVGGGQQITIRGRASMALGGQPLIYVDGIRVANDATTGPALGVAQPISRLGDINPQDIARIEVIRGPAAGTLYGTEASNGVIQIITKSGGDTGRPVIEARTRQGLQWFPDQANRIGSTWGPDPVSGEIIEFNIVRSERAAGRDIWTAGRTQGYGASVRGSGGDLAYYLSVDYDRDAGVEPTNQLERLSTRANFRLALHPSLDLTTSVGLVRSRIDLAPELNVSVLPSAIFALPALRDTPSRGFFLGPPEALWDVYDNVFQTVGRTTSGLTFEHRIGTRFTQRLQLGFDFTAETNQVIIERMREDVAPFFSQALAQGEKSMTVRDLRHTTVDYSGTFSAALTDRASSTTSVGLQYYRRFMEFTTVEGEEFPAPELTTTSAAARTFGQDDFVENTTVGVFVQQQLAWNNRLFLTGAVRADDNSAFGADFELATYPKLGVAWVVHEEPFWTVPYVSALRLRAAFGQSGQQPDSFAALRTYQPITGPGDQSAVSPGSIGNAELSPERGEEYELGFDAELLDSRVGIDFTWYHQTTRDAILMRDISPSLGFPGQQFVNAGSVRNTGMELALDAQVLTTPRVQVDLGLNLATNRNRILDLGDLDFISSGFTRHVPGFPIGSYFGQRVVSAELDGAGSPINVLCDPGPGGGDPVSCAQAPEVFLGAPVPRLEGAFTARVTLFDRLRLHAMLDFKRDYHMWDVNTWARCAAFQACEINFFPLRYDPVEVAQLQVSGSGPGAYVTDASFTKLREISATYTLPAQWTGRMGASSARITLAGRNLYTWAPHWVGMDPETVATSTWETNAYQQALMPQLTQFTASLNVIF